MPDHTVKAFDAALASLARMIAEMHEQVEKGLTDAVEALIRNDATLVKAVRVPDEPNAAMSRDIEAHLVLLIASSVDSAATAGGSRSTLHHRGMGNGNRA